MSRDLYQEVTDRIIASLEAGVAPWIKPWANDADPLPVNAASRRPYRGINVVLLSLAAQARGYARNAWLTYRQASELGAQVRGGERSTTIVFYQLRELAGREHPAMHEDEPEPKVVPFLRAYHVFNVAQIDRLPDRLNPPPVPASWDPCREAEWYLGISGARIVHSGAMAFYSPLDDRIQLPERSTFPDRASYYATALHELAHWTGHPDRLDRQLGRRFGEDVYAAEELIAEMASAFLCASCRLEGRLQHAEYIGEWLKVLKNDKRAVFTAATKAQQVVDFLEAKATTPPEPAAALEEAA